MMPHHGSTFTDRSVFTALVALVAPVAPMDPVLPVAPMTLVTLIAPIASIASVASLASRPPTPFRSPTTIDPTNLAVFAAFADLLELNNSLFLFTMGPTAPNCRHRPFRIARRPPANTFTNIPITIIVRNLDHPVTRNTIPQMFNSATTPINPTLQNEFGSMNISCRYCRALHWLVERVNSLTTHNPSTFIFESCCKKAQYS